MADFTVIKCSKCYIYKPHFNTIGRFNLILLCLSRYGLILIERQELANHTLLLFYLVHLVKWHPLVVSPYYWLELLLLV